MRHRFSLLARVTACCAIVFAALLTVGPGQTLAGQVTLAWDSNSETSLAGYKVYHGTASRTYGTPIDVGNVTTYTITGLNDGQSFFFAATAYDTLGNESGYSNEVKKVAAPGVIEINLVGNSVSIVDGDATPSPDDHTDFGSADVTLDTVTRMFTIQNTGTETLTLSGSPLVALGGGGAADFTVLSPPAPSIPAGAYTTFTVLFDPSVAGTRTATLSIPNSDANENPYGFSIQGTGTVSVAGPEINLVGNAVFIVDGDTTPTTADHTDFGGVDVAGGTVTRTFTIQNKGTEELTLSGSPPVAIGGADPEDFTIITEPPSSIAAGGSVTFKVSFDPSEASTRTATLSIFSNDANENPYNFSIRGAGTTVTSTPEINLVGNAVSIVDGDATPAAADHTDFGGATTAGGAVTRTFTIRNTGSAALSLSGSPRVSVGGGNASDFTVTALPAISVAAGGSSSFQVRFAPGATGTRFATLSIPNNDADENPYNVSIQGTGIAANPVTPEINLLGNGVGIGDGDATPTAADFTDFGGAKVNGGTVTRNFTIRNTGTTALTLPGSPRVVVGGTHAADFTVTAQPSASVAATGSTRFQVRFDPRAAGARYATITFASNDADENPYNFAIRGTGTVPDINLVANAASVAEGDTVLAAANQTDFGSTNIAGGTITRTFTVQNTGTAVLNLSGSPMVALRGPNASDFAVKVRPAASVAPSGSTTFQLRFDPKAAGTRLATISIVSNDDDENPCEYSIQGAGFIAPEIAFFGNGRGIADGNTTPSAADHTDFGSTKVDSGTVTRTFTIRNTGSAALNLSGSPLVTVSGASAADFTVAVMPAASVAVGGSTTFKVIFDPAAAGVRKATLSIASDDPDEGSYEVAIQGLGTVPEIDVAGNGVSIVDGDTFAALADFTDFGGAKLGGPTVTRTFTIRNTGTAPLLLPGLPRVAVGGEHAMDFSVTLQPASPVAAGGSTKFQVRFNPSAVGTRSGTITIDNNDGNEHPYNFAIKGTGTVPEINLLGNSTRVADGDSTPSVADHSDFGEANIAGGTVTRTFTIQNTGKAALVLSGSPPVLIRGPNAADFAVRVRPPASIAAGGTAKFEVRFDPKAAGLRMATVSIPSDDADEDPYDFAIQGTGTIAPEINLVGNGMGIANDDTTPAAADYTDFGGAKLDGGTVARTFTIRNAGSAALNLTGSPLVGVTGAHAADFKVATLPAATVAIAGSTTFKVLFDPGAAGVRTATITIASDDADENPYEFSIQGEGVAPPAAPTNISIRQ
jgi:hypothetical protein